MLPGFHTELVLWKLLSVTSLHLLERLALAVGPRAGAHLPTEGPPLCGDLRLALGGGSRPSGAQESPARTDQAQGTLTLQCWIPATNHQFIAIRGGSRPLLSWWRSSSASKTPGEGLANQPGVPPNEALMRGACGWPLWRSPRRRRPGWTRGDEVISSPSRSRSPANPVEGQLRPSARASTVPAPPWSNSELLQETQELHATMQTRSLPSPQYA